MIYALYKACLSDGANVPALASLFLHYGMHFLTSETLGLLLPSPG
jgi:hypothetical protein